MKALRFFTVIVFIAVTCLFIWFFFDSMMNEDNSQPVIQINGDVLEVSIYDDDQVLLRGVSAYDEKDGDISGRIIVESVSTFADDGSCTVTYAVADSDKHVAKNTRKILYKDYTSPRFELEQALVFAVGKSLNIQSLVGASDCLDGDISHSVIVAATDYTDNAVGVFTLSLQATNSKGDTIYLDLPLYVEEVNLRSPVIELTQYLVYLQKGEELDAESYISSMSSSYYTVDEDSLLISQLPDTQIPGVYTVHYYVLDNLGNEGHTVLTVVVEE